MLVITIAFISIKLILITVTKADARNDIVKLVNIEYSIDVAILLRPWS